jgi:hypothetical protein
MQPPYQPMPTPGQPQWQPQAQPPAAPTWPLVYRLHAGARSALNIAGGLLVLLVITIPIAILIFMRTAAARIELSPEELVFRNLFSKRVKLGTMRRLGWLSVPVVARGIGGALARRKVGGPAAIHLCSIDERGKKFNVPVSMFERYQEIIQQVSALTRLPVEEVKMGVFGPKWPGA